MPRSWRCASPIGKSGKSKWVHFRWACPKFLRQSFHEFAAQSVRFSPWAASFYQHQRARGKGHHAAVRALAYKWIRILYRCWKTRQPYNPELYLTALLQRGSPYASAVNNSTHKIDRPPQTSGEKLSRTIQRLHGVTCNAQSIIDGTAPSTCSGAGTTSSSARIDCVKSHAAKPVVVSTILDSTETLHAGAVATKSRSNCSSSSRVRAGFSYSSPGRGRDQPCQEFLKS